MLNSFLTISLVGLAVGIIFSMPIAGPVSILITSHGLRGQLRYCLTAAIGASIIDFIVCFIAVHGFSTLFGLYQYIVPYVLFGGSIFLFIVGLRIVKARFDFDHLDVKQSGLKRVLKLQEKSGFWTGLLLNASNPTLFLGWLTTSFFVMSFVSSVGLNVGGLDHMLNNNVVTVNSYANHTDKDKQIPGITVPKTMKTPAVRQTEKGAAEDVSSPPAQIFYSLSYAFFLAVGTIIWFSVLAYLLVRHRAKVSVNLISRVIHGLGIFLCGFAVYLLWRAVNVFTPL
jgi:threonine/homoserine/homoserine lactone efflux protein